MAVVTRALVVEAVADFVADDRTDGTEVLRRIGCRVEERWLQDRGWEGDVIDHRVVEGVDGLRGSHPLVAVRRFAHLGHLVVMLKSSTGTHVGHQVTAFAGKLKALIGTPGVGIADLRVEQAQLLQCALARLR